MYTGFAEVYDTLMNDVHYGAWADMYARMMTAYGIPRNAKVCECACGTGSLTLPLQQLGYEMMGIDLSQEMLWQAAQKARKAGFGIPFIRQDMRQLRLHRPVDAVLATCDGVNYLLQDVDAAAHLPLLRLGGPARQEPQRIVKSVAPGGAPELEKELLAIFERTYGAIRRRDVLPQMMLRSEDKREFLQSLGPADDFLLVDGYNILFAWDELKELARTSLDTARHVLMNLLCNYQGYRGCTLILVFDAYKVPQGLGAVEKYHNIHIVYTRQAETADQYIERLSFELRGRRRVRVATSDNLEQLIILGHGAERISAQHFHDEVYTAQAEIERILSQNNQKNAK